MRALWCSLSAGLCLHRPWFEMTAYPVQGSERRDGRTDEEMKELCSRVCDPSLVPLSKKNLW